MLLKYFSIISIFFIQFYNTGNQISSFLSYVLIFVLIVYNLINIKGFMNGSLKFIFSKLDFLILLFFISLIRSFFGHAITIQTFLYLSAILILFSSLLKADVQKEDFWSCFLGAIILLCVLNLVFFSVGITSDIFRYKRNNDIRILSYIGISIKRVNFLIFNNFAYYSMLLSLSVLSVISFLNLKKLSYLAVLTLCFVSMVLLDARGPLFSLILIVLFQRFLTKINSKNILILFIAIIIVPFIYSLISAYFGLEKEDNLELASSRDIIWGFFINFYDPNFTQLIFGYGYLGQYISGISDNYDYLFEEWDNGSQISLHNSYLQYLADIGLLGLYIFYSILKSTLVKIDELGFTKSKLILIYLLLIGVTEMSVQMNNFVCFYFFIAFISYIDFQYNKLSILNFNIKKKISS